ncbi:hypothetical protein FHX44_112954 [Pseudonocardia hierapolitana]|uniref:Uncharacterized protein n=1 Tax=Pseudonocardia hierapolitana TaxID=1128676 RepID=A0A561SQC6_9PSEU|nr:hypothetical protein [Pseudonocardia hierapolitana]TWF77053.1 hypothetical protein FHX44_112954 [Pseudonocardia hierapolitana]
MPGAPVVVICIDGSEPCYHVAALGAGRMPWLRGVLDGEGSSWPAHCALLALTNPNNLSIATGRARHERASTTPDLYTRRTDDSTRILRALNDEDPDDGAAGAPVPA